MSQGMLNLHNHTPFSDGAYLIDELCEAHLDCDFDVAGIAITDDLFCTPSSREVNNEREFERIFGKETRSYVNEVLAARQNWSDKLDIYCGAFINWPLNKTHLDTIRRNLDGIDFVMFGFVDWAGLTTLANQARRWPCPVGLANTDIRANFPNTSMDQVVRTLANARIFYEVSPKLLPLGEHEQWFKILPNHRVHVAIGTDTHDDLSCLDDLPKLYDYVLDHNLESKLFVPRIRAEEAVSV
jgi:hypothetical protein